MLPSYIILNIYVIIKQQFDESPLRWLDAYHVKLHSSILMGHTV